ncbi:MAG: hypothetical protein AAB699_03170 [Patescibacteria group bacterium]
MVFGKRPAAFIAAVFSKGVVSNYNHTFTFYPLRMETSSMCAMKRHFFAATVWAAIILISGFQLVRDYHHIFALAGITEEYQRLPYRVILKREQGAVASVHIPSLIVTALWALLGIFQIDVAPSFLDKLVLLLRRRAYKLLGVTVLLIFRTVSVYWRFGICHIFFLSVLLNFSQSLPDRHTRCLCRFGSGIYRRGP